MDWDKDSVEQVLIEHSLYKEQREIEHATQFMLTDGTTKVNCFRTGRVQIQGPDSDLKKQASDLFNQQTAYRPQSPKVTSSPPKRVFIVYGHDVRAREQLELILRRLKLDPVVLQNIPGGGDIIIEKLEKLTNADFACVLLTPDDEGRKKEVTGNEAETLRPRARQNVVLETGMVLSRLGRNRVAILVKGDDIERPSDIDGLIYIPFSEHVEEALNSLAANLQQVGFHIQVSDLLPQHT